MRIKIIVNGQNLLVLQERLSAGAIREGWSEGVMQLAQRNAMNKLGGGKFSQTVRRSIRYELKEQSGEVYVGGPDWKAAVHAHTGGPIQSGNGKMLAIPSKWNDKKDLFASEWTKDSLFFLRSKRKNKAYLFETPVKGEKLGRPMFFLTRKTKPQKARPWWPDTQEAMTAGEQYFNENF